MIDSRFRELVSCYTRKGLFVGLLVGSLSAATLGFRAFLVRENLRSVLEAQYLAAAIFGSSLAIGPTVGLFAGAYFYDRERKQ